MINFFKLIGSIICLLIACIATGQTLIKGTVITGKKQNPLAEVQIQVRGTSISTTTDKSGNYTMEIPSSVSYDITFASPLPASNANAPVLIFSLEGYETQFVVFQGVSKLDVLLPRLNSEVANNVQDPKTATTTIGVLTEAELQQVVSPYLGQNLSAKIAGLQAFSTALAPGQDVALQLRAANTFANGQQPLLLLDDIFLSETSLADINPDDIAYVEVLKGAASAGYYGSRAANGVIRLFSKRGKGLSDGENRITYRTEYGFSRQANQFDLNTLTNRAITNPNGPQPVLGETNSNATYQETLPNLQDYQENTLFRNGAFNTNYLAMEGQSGNTNFFGSAQRMQDQGILQGVEGYTRYAFRLNLDHQFNQKLSFNASSQFSFANQALPEESPNHPQGLLATTLQLTPIYDLNVPNEEDGTAFDWDIDNTGNGITNPLYRRANTAQMVDRNRILGNLTLNYQPTNWFKMSYAALLDRSNHTYEQFLEKGYLSSLRPSGFGEMATFGIDGSKGGGFLRSTQQQQTFVAHGNATVDKRLAKLRIRLGIDGWYEYLGSAFHSIGGENLAVSSIRSLDNIQSNLVATSKQSEAETFSGSLSSEVNYSNKYIFHGTLRIEESSLFGAKELTADYYQAGVAWRVTEDLKIKGVQDLKLRAAIGTAGIRPTFFNNLLIITSSMEW
ncbi:MAG: TonB-dependent receptor plug domain-containing protein [Saprospiraceae bacterium]|nr:TonB-dependent receptor plug domain-containing protein [Saprospiraceae bacterium]